jgi:hypothetical protein
VLFPRLQSPVIDQPDPETVEVGLGAFHLGCSLHRDSGEGEDHLAWDESWREEGVDDEGSAEEVVVVVEVVVKEVVQLKREIYACECCE